MAEPATDRPDVPTPAAWLGGAGLIPFVGLALLAALGDETVSGLARDGVAAYGAVILSFMGGCRWGFAAAGLGEGPDWASLALSVMPALLAWPALFATDPVRVLLLAAGFAALLAADVMLTRRGGAPRWWPRLRWPLTAGAVGSLLVAAAVA
jgi:hypothetical protein